MTPLFYQFTYLDSVSISHNKVLNLVVNKQIDQTDCRTNILQDKQTAGQTDCRTNRLQDKQTAGQTDCRTNRLQDKQTAGQTDCRTNILHDKQTAGQTDCSNPPRVEAVNHY